MNFSLISRRFNLQIERGREAVTGPVLSYAQFEFITRPDGRFDVSYRIGCLRALADTRTNICIHIRVYSVLRGHSVSRIHYVALVTVAENIDDFYRVRVGRTGARERERGKNECVRGPTYIYVPR